MKCLVKYGEKNGILYYNGDRYRMLYIKPLTVIVIIESNEGVVKNEEVLVNDLPYITNEKGEISLTEEIGITKSFTFSYNGKNKTIEIVFDVEKTITVELKKPEYTEVSWKSPGTYTWTCPEGITRVRVALCGGGGAGAVHESDEQHRTNQNGGSSSCFGLIATGGDSAMDGTFESSSPYFPTHSNSGGTPNGKQGTIKNVAINTPVNKRNASVSTNNGFDLSFDKVTGTYGNGGGASITETHTGDGYSYYIGAYSGGTGGYISDYADVIPLTIYTIIVGGHPTEHGTNWEDKFSGSVQGGGSYTTEFSIEQGTDGFVLLAYGGDI